MSNLPYSSALWSTHSLAAPPTFDYPWPDDDRALTLTRTFEGPATAYARRLNQRTSYTNLLLRSTTPDHASWTESEVTASNNTYANPENGAVTAGQILETTANAIHSLEQAVALSGPGVFSVCVKGIGRTNLTLRLTRTGAMAGGYFDLAAGTAATSLSIVDTPTVGINALGDGWFRCWVASSAGDATTVAQIIIGGFNYAGDITKGLALYGPQLELGATPGPVILTTSATVTISSPDVDAIAQPTAQLANPFAYLCAESGLAPLGGAASRYTRSYATLPADQYEPLSKYFVRPILDGVVSGSYYAASFDNGITSHLWSSRKTVTRVSSVAAVTTTAARPSGTVTCTDTLGAVATFAGNASAATIDAALATLGLTSPSSSVTTGQIVLNWSSFGPVGMASIVPPSGMVLTFFSGAYSAILTSTGTSTTPEITTLDASSHGAQVGDSLALWSGATLVGRATVVSVPDTNSVAVMTSDLSAANTQITHLTVSRGAVVRVVNGGKDCTARRRHRFYLPGVTSGITDRADIPNFDITIDPIAWLGVISAYYASPSENTYAVIETEEVQRYPVPQSPIIDKAVIEVQVADAYQTRSV
jgi:hypothetical protein